LAIGQVRLARRAPEEAARRAFNSAIEITEAIGDPITRSKALSALARLLPEPLQERAVGGAVTATSEIADLSARASALEDLATELPSKAAEEAMAAALNAARGGVPLQDRVAALTMLLPRLPLALHSDALRSIEEIADVESRAGLAVALALVTSRELQEDCIKIVIDDLAELQRPRLLTILSSLLPVIKAHAGDEGLRVLLQAISDTANWQA
jgi:hypothetical protein